MPQMRRTSSRTEVQLASNGLSSGRNQTLNSLAGGRGTYIVRQVLEIHSWSSGLSFRHLFEQVRNHVINCGLLLHGGQPAMG